ncbi:uncharacterized protein LOC144666739 [Oculina patagonica]
MKTLRNLTLQFKLLFVVLSNITAFQSSIFTESQAGVMTSSTFTVGVNLSTVDTGLQPANTSASTLKLSPSFDATGLQRTSPFVFTPRLSPSLGDTGFQSATSFLSAMTLTSSSRATRFTSTGSSNFTGVKLYHFISMQAAVDEM